MILVELTNEEKSRLERLNNDRGTVFALKKLFLNECAGSPLAHDVATLAAERLALECIKEVFHTLSTIKPDDKPGIIEDNVV